MTAKSGMINFKVAISNFFRDEKLFIAVERAEFRALRWQGGYVRKAAQNLIVKPTRPNSRSAPGKPPFDQTGRFKRSILFSYDKPSHSVVVGPVLYSAKHGVIPAALEHGGTTLIDERRPDFSTGERKMIRTGRKKRITIKPRPFMGPALQASESHLADIWRNSVRAR